MPAFLVDGDLEKRFFQRQCPKMMVKKIGCNGRNVSIDEIARRIATQIRTLGGKCFPIVVVTDREGRDESAPDMANALLEKIRNEGINDELIIAVTDRMIENWILADYDTVIAYTDAVPLKHRPDTFDGENGKAKLKKIISSYHETTIGVDLLCRCRPSIMSRASTSFSTFFEQIQRQIQGCHWLRN